MLSAKESQTILLKLFRNQRVATLDQLFTALNTHSRMSVFRRLKPLDYLSSFTDAGRYYTLRSIPKFDLVGLWFYREIGFSRMGTLKVTVTEQVNSSESGMTSKELLNLLRLKVPNSLHNTLYGLVKNKDLNRQKLNKIALYTSIDPNTAQKQIRARRQRLKRHLQLPFVPSVETTIAVLVETLKHGSVLPPASSVALSLNAQGIEITSGQVQHIYKQHSLSAEKKTAGRP